MFKADRKASDTIVGIIVEKDGKLQISPCSKKERHKQYHLNFSNANGARIGDVIVAKRVPQPGGSDTATVTRILGQKTTPGILSLISLCEKGLSEVFSQAALDEAKAMTVPDLQGREDLRAIPLVTIDGPDSRDFDDAVYAKQTEDGGFHLIVAIADVSWYVRPGSKLDEDAFARGNSTYFPDMVAPMLPEALSNGLCSLKPHEDRACMAFHLQIDKDGNLTGQKVVRALMNSAARLTYEQVQDAKDGKPDATTAPLMNDVINPLYAAYAVLREAREKRGALDFDMPEHKVTVGADGRASDVAQYVRRDSNKLIEEFMVLANVAAATALESKKSPCVYRVHDKPPYQDDVHHAGPVDALREYLGAFGLILPAGEVTTPLTFKDILAKAAQMPNGPLIAKAIARVQAKATYDTKNIGHFGLALERYAHFTSPIRRYADLLVHRSLVNAFNLGAGGLDSDQKTHLDEMASHINESEKLSSHAERSSHDRFAAAFLAARVGHTFTGRIATVTNAGLFVRLDKAGIDGLLPISRLPHDFYDLDKDQHTLKGRDSGRIYRTGATITVRLKEANPLTGAVLVIPANDNSADVPGVQFKKKAPKQNQHKPRQ